MRISDWSSDVCSSVLHRGQQAGDRRPDLCRLRGDGAWHAMKLLQPLAINGMTLPNRVAVPAMVTRLSGEDGFVNQDIIDRYVRYAQGHVGLIVVEATAVYGNKSGPPLRLSTDDIIYGTAEQHRQGPDTPQQQVV